MADEKVPTLGADDRLPQKFLPEYLTAQELDTKYVPKSQTVIALDTDDVPYYGTAFTVGSAAVPVGTDDDGVPYVMV